MRTRSVAGFLLAAMAWAGCSAPSGTDGTAAGAAPLAGPWRAVLTSPGGELPFTLRIEPPGSTPPAVALNGEEQVPFTSLVRDGNRLTLRIEGYDSQIEARLSSDGSVLHGEWSKTIPDGRSRLPFTGYRGETHRFSPAEQAALAAAAADTAPPPAQIAGAWSVLFRDDSGEESARGEFRQQGDRVEGTFLTPTGDYRYLEGDYRDGLLRLSCFDGGHAFLFRARVTGDGMEGDFWSRDTYHATWTARRAEGEQALPDPFEIVRVTSDDGRFRFRFPDLDGRDLSWDDPRLAGKVVLVNIFGSWCPNCNDEAPLLADWDRRYRDRGLAIVGLAFEFSGRPERDRIFVGKYAERHGLEFPLLLAGVSDKKQAAQAVPDLSHIAAYPTNVFIGRDGKVKRVHSGFAGPGTGAHHHELVRELESVIEALLAEP